MAGLSSLEALLLAQYEEMVNDISLGYAEQYLSYEAAAEQSGVDLDNADLDLLFSAASIPSSDSMALDMAQSREVNIFSLSPNQPTPLVCV